MADGVLTLDGPEATAALGARIAAALRPGDLVALSGPLGAGKSVLARGLVRALTGPDEEVPSPTFTLIQTYDGRDFPLAHLDLYRLRRPEEAWELGLEEALADGAAVVEWPERLEHLLPGDRLAVTLAAPPPSEADAGGGPAAARRLARLEGFGSWTGRVAPLLRPPHAAAAPRPHGPR